jgi:hypothetical protein
MKHLDANWRCQTCVGTGPGCRGLHPLSVPRCAQGCGAGRCAAVGSSPGVAIIAGALLSTWPPRAGFGWLTDGAGIMVGPGTDARVFAAGQPVLRKILSGMDVPTIPERFVEGLFRCRHGRPENKSSHLWAASQAAIRHFAQSCADLKPLSLH